jgi:hypothetical protein
VVEDVQAVVGIRGQCHLGVLQGVYLLVFVHHLPVNSHLLEPGPSDLGQFFDHVLYSQACELPQTFLFCDVFHLLGLDLEDTSKDAAGKQPFSCLFVESFLGLLNADLSEEVGLLFEDVALTVGSEGAVPKDEASYLAGREVALKLRAVSHFDVGDTFVAAQCGVEAEVGEGGQIAVHGELGAGHVERTDRRVVADLLVVNGDALDVGLEGLAQDGVEGLQHDQLEGGDVGKESDYVLDLG